MKNKSAHVAAPVVNRRSAANELLDDFDKIIDRAAKTMTDKEFREAEKQFNETVRRPAASPSRRRETA